MATFYDAKNNTIGTASTYTELKIIKPKQKAPFEIYFSLTSTNSVPVGYELTLSYVKTNVETTNGLEVVRQTSGIDENGYYRIVGEVRNNGARKAFSVKIICTYYDSPSNIARACE